MKYGAIFVFILATIQVLTQTLLYWIIYGLGCELTNMDVGMTTFFGVALGAVAGVVTAGVTSDRDKLKKGKKDE
jgi:uncharacterized membrane protein